MFAFRQQAGGPASFRDGVEFTAAARTCCAIKCGSLPVRAVSNDPLWLFMEK